ncbi:MAG: T9SS type A sorting domain-containing protein [Clostridiales bacterium]
MDLLKYSLIAASILFSSVLNNLYADPVSFIISNKADSVSIFNQGRLAAKILWAQGVVYGSNVTINADVSQHNILPPGIKGSGYSLNLPIEISLKDLSDINFNFGSVKLRIYSTLSDFNLSDLKDNIAAYKVTNDTSYQNLINNSWFTSSGKDYFEFPLNGLSKNQTIIAAVINILSGSYDTSSLSGSLEGNLLVPKGKEAILNEGISLSAGSSTRAIKVRGKLTLNGTKNAPVNLNNIVISAEGNDDSVFTNNENKITCKYVNAYSLVLKSSDAYAEDSRFTSIGTYAYSALRAMRCKLNYGFVNSSKVLIDSTEFDSTGYFITAANSIAEIRNSIIYKFQDVDSRLENSYIHLNNNTIYSEAFSLFSALKCFLLIENSRFLFPLNYSENFNCEGIPVWEDCYAVIRNNIVKGFRSGVEIDYSSKAVIYNNTFVENTAGIVVNGMPVETYIYNNIFYKNTMASIDLDYSTSFADTSNLAYVDNNLYTEGKFILNSWGHKNIVNQGTNNFLADPGFQNGTEYYLKSTSAAIDRGTTVIKSFSKVFPVLDSVFTIPSTITIEQYSGKAPDLGAKEYGNTSGIANKINSVSEYRLEHNYPNPFNPVTTIGYSIPKASYVELNVYDMLGREVTSLVRKEQTAGEYKVQFDGSSLPSGIYIYSIQAGHFRDSKKLVLLK